MCINTQCKYVEYNGDENIFQTDAHHTLLYDDMNMMLHE